MYIHPLNNYKGQYIKIYFIFKIEPSAVKMCIQCLETPCMYLDLC